MISMRLVYTLMRVLVGLLFLTLGVAILLQITNWSSNWLPTVAIHLAERLGLAANQFLYIVAIFSIITAVSYFSGLFIRWFAVVAVLIMLLPVLGSVFIFAKILSLFIIALLLLLTQWPDGPVRY